MKIDTTKMTELYLGMAEGGESFGLSRNDWDGAWAAELNLPRPTYKVIGADAYGNKLLTNEHGERVFYCAPFGGACLVD
tara:strand:- start:3355 stop:3591 length:237 start_codon:yes stop_codon:yes gene_type:complete